MKKINFLTNNLIAHRGVYNSKVIENTIPAFLKCLDKNYIVELDIHILIDGTIVVYHDYNLFRLTGVNKIIETLSYPQLAKIKIKKKYTIPTLKQVIHILNKKIPLLIEIKNINNNNFFEEELVKILDDYDGDFAIQSTNKNVIDWFYKNRKNYIIGLVILNSFNYKMSKEIIKRVDFISINKKLLPTGINKIVLGWTINNNFEYNKYKNLCNNLICENIELFDKNCKLC